MKNLHVFFFFYAPFWKICFYQAKYLFLFRYSKRLVCKLWGLSVYMPDIQVYCRIITSCAIELDWSYILMDTRAAAWRISLFEEEYPFHAGEGVISLKVWPFLFNRTLNSTCHPLNNNKSKSLGFLEEYLFLCRVKLKREKMKATVFNPIQQHMLMMFDYDNNE